MPVIRISEASWNRLKRWAEPLEDSPDDVIKKILDRVELSEDLANPTGSVPQTTRNIPNSSNYGRDDVGTEASTDSVQDTGVVIPSWMEKRSRISRGDFREPVLQSLFENGGKTSSKAALARVEELLRLRLTAWDYHTYKDGQTRWEKNAHFARLQLVEEGLIKRKEDSGQGMWELSECEMKEMTGKTG